MNITTRLVIQHFLKKLSEELQQSKSDALDSFFEGFFLEEELIEIHKWVYGDDDEMHKQVDQLTASETLEFLNNGFILDYFRASWEKQIEQHLSITVDSVVDTLEQLGHHNHYLRFKSLDKWDEYDFSNYRVLSGKARKVYTVYGIYDISVEPEMLKDKDISHPKRFFETYQKAKDAVDQFYFDPNENKVHSLLVGDA